MCCGKKMKMQLPTKETNSVNPPKQNAALILNKAAFFNFYNTLKEK